jgi:hypothetical protein
MAPLIGMFGGSSIKNLGFARRALNRANSVLFRTLNESTYVVEATDTYRVWIGGGGGAGAAGTGGSGGIFSFDIQLNAGETIYAGVGAGGATNSGAIRNNTSTYQIYGGRGGTGSTGGGGGGGGSYLKLALPGARAHWNNYVGISGGGGGSARHSFTSNYGGHGFGDGGGGYESFYEGTYAGVQGFSSNGSGGSAQSSGANGGSANNQNQLHGGSGGGTQNEGGGGGGGAGGGAGGAGGGSCSSGFAGGNGGLISSTTSANGFSTVANPRGGGGGGSHGCSCGGCGGGGGILLFSSYPNSWGTSQGSQIPNWSSASTSLTYTAWNALDNNIKSSYLSGKCLGGTPSTNGGDGFVYILPLNTYSGNITLT